MDTPTSETRQHRSVSQLKQYERCAYSYYLAREARVWQRPAAWLPQGSAVHTVAEVYEKRKLEGQPLSLEQAQDLFRKEYAKEVQQYADVTPNLEYWFRSGPYAGEADIERRFLIGLEQVEKFIAWTEGHPEEVIWIAPDGTPGIELAFDFDLDGVLIRGFIDAVIEINGEPRVIDYKTGNTPGDDFQLGTYKVALEELYGLSVESGAYYMAGKAGAKGKPTHPYDLTEWTREKVSEKFRELDDNIRAGLFPADPEPSKCNFCDVALACEYNSA